MDHKFKLILAIIVVVFILIVVLKQENYQPILSGIRTPYNQLPIDVQDIIGSYLSKPEKELLEVKAILGENMPIEITDLVADYTDLRTKILELKIRDKMVTLIASALVKKFCYVNLRYVNTSAMEEDIKKSLVEFLEENEEDLKELNDEEEIDMYMEGSDIYYTIQAILIGLKPMFMEDDIGRGFDVRCRGFDLKIQSFISKQVFNMLKTKA